MTMTEKDFVSAGHVARVLIDTPFMQPAKWPAAVVVWTKDSRRVMSRAQHAQWLASRGAGAAANACLRRKVPPGHVLVWSDRDDVAAHGAFRVVDVGGAIREQAEGPFLPADASSEGVDNG